MSFSRFGKATLAGIFLAFILIFQSCRKDEMGPTYYKYLSEPACTSLFVPKDYDYQVVGFYPSWKQDILPIDSIKWDKLTRIIYAFAYPNTNGTVNFSSLTKANELIEKGHANGVEVFFSIGGGGDSDNFIKIANNYDAADRLVKSLRHLVFSYCFDGVDIDWEKFTGLSTGSINTIESHAYIRILRELQEDLLPFNKKISVDLYPTNWGGKHYFDDLVNYVDDIMIMCYNFSGSWSDPGPHSSYEDAIGSGSSALSTGLAYWVNYRGFPRAKVLLGVPFYGKDFDNQAAGISYKSIVELYPDAPNHDQVGNIYYDGVETMQRKTQYVIENQYAGVMIWELAHDTQVDSVSLLNAIDEAIQSYQ